jgi:plasmanylethanolamine desaturase
VQTNTQTLQLRAGYKGPQRLLQLVGISLFFAWTPYVLLRTLNIAINLAVPQAPVLIAMAVLAGYLFADFASGFVHWFCDNYGSESWPIVGPAFIRPFRHHHVAPEDLCEHGFVQLNGNNCVVSLLAFWWATLPTVSHESGVQVVFLGFFWLSVAWFTFGTNQFHAWAHSDDPPRIAIWLQKKRLILPPSHHDIHHSPPHYKAYCITTGLMDKPLRALAFFPLAEGLIEKIFGVKPLHKKRGV